jgi:hypothetical protein
MWVSLRPLCAFIGVSQVDKNSWACIPTSLGPEISWQVIAVGAVLLLGGSLVGWLLLLLQRANRPEVPAEVRGLALVRAAGGFVGLGVALVLAFSLVPSTTALVLGSVPREILAVAMAVPLGIVAYLAFTARSPRRFVTGNVLIAGLLFIVMYPNWSGLPLPDSAFNSYQLILPSWQFAFRFPVNTSEATPIALLVPMPFLLLGAVLLAGVFVAYSAWVWRLAIIERQADDAPVEGVGPLGG